ncbi:MAG: hypothetical protein IKP65_05660 [Alphaproteobacteria bacterium]|nr:hypothetical protein [Alphaproteobacteria bacterium]
MKKALLLPLLLCACSQFDVLRETIKNENCQDYAAFEVYQVGSDYVLAKACDNTLFGKCHHTTAVKLAKEAGETYFDSKMVEIPAGKCAVHSGIYEYKTGLGEKRTIPVVKFEESRLPNPDYIK